MKTKKLVLLTLAGLMIAFIPMDSFAQRGDGMGYRNRTFDREIPGLTDQQKERIDAIGKTHAREALTISNKITEKHAALRTVTQQNEPDAQKANQLLEEIYNLRLDLAKMRLESRLNIRKELNDDQKLFFDTQTYRMGRHDLNGTRPFMKDCPRCGMGSFRDGPMRRGMVRPDRGTN